MKAAAWRPPEDVRPLPARASPPALAAVTHFGAEPRAGSAAIKPRRDIFFIVNPSPVFRGDALVLLRRADRYFVPPMSARVYCWFKSWLIATSSRTVPPQGHRKKAPECYSERVYATKGSWYHRVSVLWGNSGDGVMAVEQRKPDALPQV